MADARDLANGRNRREPAKGQLLAATARRQRYKWKSGTRDAASAVTQRVMPTALSLPSGPRSRAPAADQVCTRLVCGFSCQGAFPPVAPWRAVDPLIVRLGLLTVLCSERERPFFVPSPAIRFPERAEGVKGDRNASAAWRRAAVAEACVSQRLDA